LKADAGHMPSSFVFFLLLLPVFVRIIPGGGLSTRLYLSNECY
jgi:hypothetical protein